MTVMFCDIVESTPMTQTIDPEDLREVLSDYQHACARAVERFGGYIARYAGDGLVVYFGYPRAREDSAQGAVHAGLGILDELVPLSAQLTERYGFGLSVRIGIHTGLVVAGDMGTDTTRDQLAIVGDTPHIAARLESIAEPGTVVISDATRDLIEGYFETDPLGDKQLRGVSRLVGVHRVLRSTGAIGRLEVAGARRLTPLVGRDGELARLAEVWQRVKGGHGAVVHLTGEAGIGKSRIVRELVDRLGQQVGAEQIWQCSAHHQSTTLYPVIRFLERFIGLNRADPVKRQLEMIREAAVAADLDIGEAVPLLADLLAIGGHGEDVRSPLSPRDARTATLHVIESLLVTDRGRHPLLVVVEDVHWADPTTVELLGRLIANLPRSPVMCVLTFRPEFAAPWSDGAAIGVALRPLTSEGVRALAAWASPKPLDPAVLEWVDSAADGIPLFVEETLKMFEHAGGADIRRPETGHTVVPSTLQGLLTERLDRLPELVDLIDVAAVLGREFDRGQLEALWPPDSPPLESALIQLATHDVLRPVAGAPSRCEFSHALLQEAAYERILRRRRQTLHGRVASSLVEIAASEADREPEVVAHHWSCAAQPAKAVHYWHAAGTRALERAAFLEASHHFRSGLEALDEVGPDPGDDPERADFYVHLAASLQAGHGYAAAGVDEAYAKARSSSQRAGNQGRLIPVIRGEWLFHLLRSEYGIARELADEMLDLGQRNGDPVLLAEGHLYCGFVHMYVADFDDAREQLEDAFDRYRRPEQVDAIYEAQGDTGVMALAYGALVLWNLGHADRSQPTAGRARRRPGDARAGLGDAQHHAPDAM
jgi:class 3 adenylate cyclase/tetratricopeptide (TPR) repeat protein